MKKGPIECWMISEKIFKNDDLLKEHLKKLCSIKNPKIELEKISKSSDEPQEVISSIVGTKAPKKTKQIRLRCVQSNFGPQIETSANVIQVLKELEDEEKFLQEQLEKVKNEYKKAVGEKEKREATYFSLQINDLPRELEKFIKQKLKQNMGYSVYSSSIYH